MARISENDELGTTNHPIRLVRRRHRRVEQEDIDRAIAERTEAREDQEPEPLGVFVIPDDRMSPAVSGGIAGFAGGLAALGSVHALAPAALARPVLAVAEARGVDLAVSFGVAYVTAAAVGALVGGTFAVVTRYLRRWGPLLLWALVFFVSLATLLLALSSAYGRGAGPALSGPILAASAAFAVVVSFSLPIRRRR
ncbi:MAG: hypothetical protein KF782_10645 [Labilithrix sp.]|nr:hypothetical protein [Labilithrix sp.]